MSVSVQTQAVIEALAYARKFSGNTVLIKLGGSILKCKNSIKSLCEDICLLRSVGIKLVLVHGGSHAIKAALETYKINSEFVDGLRVTSKEAIDIIEMVLCGQINPLLVRTLNHLGVAAMGLSGADHQMLLCDAHSEEHGYVGKVKFVETKIIETVLRLQNNDFGTIPVIAPIGVNAEGEAMNINADWAAYAIASALKISKLIYLTDQEGILDGQRKVISEIDSLEINRLINEDVIQGGMATKAKTILAALEDGVSDIHILNAHRPHVLVSELFTAEGVGTLCKRNLNINNCA